MVLPRVRPSGCVCAPGGSAAGGLDGFFVALHGREDARVFLGLAAGGFLLFNLPGGLVDRRESYDDYLDSEAAAQQREALM